MNTNEVNAAISFDILAVESIPCELRNQTVAFDRNGNLVSEPLVTPWPMPWVTEELNLLADGTNEMPEEETFRVYNPEEPDQYVYVRVTKN